MLSRLLPLGAAAATLLCAQTLDPSLYQALRWRQIGPFRAGRVSAATGIPGNPAVFYMGTPGGGLWKTVDAGTVWFPVFDAAKISSIGSVAVAPSRPDTVYVGTGEVALVGSSVNMGNGMWKSTDAGKTWQHIGLEETEHIGALWVDPHNPDVVLAAALGRTYSKNEQRGVFKTTDGGRTWRKVLYKDDTVGAVDLVMADENGKIGYAALWEHVTKPGQRYSIESSGFAGVYKTTDGGETWTQLSEDLPSGRLGRIGVATDKTGQRVFAIVAGGGGPGGGGRGPAGAGGLYRSDDAGAHWAKSTPDSRVTGSGYFSRVFVDPKNPDIVYVAQTSLYRSSDGGKTFVSYKGAPGGDDNHAVWIDPIDTDRMIMSSDQGATISMDGGKSWSTWYNQPTAQIYHMSTDNRYPYWVYGTQQDSGSVGTLSRGDYGEITFLDWDPVGGYEFGYIVPDPLNNNLVYAGGPSRGIVRIDRSNRQVATVSPSLMRGADNTYHTAQNPPLGFSPQDKHVLYYGTQFLLATSDGGIHWKTMSPDLTVRPAEPRAPAPPPVADTATPPGVPLRPKVQEEQETVNPNNRAAINCFAPSPVAAGEIWIGTNNGMIRITRDNGATWQNVSPPGLGPNTYVSIVEASHFDAGTAWVAIDRHEENDFRPHFYRTRDFGKTWQESNAGITDPLAFSRVVREDPTRKGLLYAGTEDGMYWSNDDGDHWLSLQLNLPVTSVRDMEVHGDELVIATYGRAFWILDGLAPLRQFDRPVLTSDGFLFRPGKALRVRLDQNQDTPIPPEMPAGQNPPNGAILDYYIKGTPKDDVTLQVFNSSGQMVREFSTKPGEDLHEPPPNVPDYWIGHPDPLTKHPGLNRFVWDLTATAPPVLRHEYPISALYGATPALPLGAIVEPGTYRVRVTIDDKSYEQPLTVTMDPRVDVSTEALREEYRLNTQVIDLVALSFDFYKKASALRQQLAAEQKELEKKPEKKPAGTDDVISAVKAFDQKALRVQGSEGGFGGGGGGGRGGPQQPAFTALNRNLGSLATAIDGQDAAPTPAMNEAFGKSCEDLAKAANQWNDLMKDLPKLNEGLRSQNVAPVNAVTLNPPACK